MSNQVKFFFPFPYNIPYIPLQIIWKINKSFNICVYMFSIAVWYAFVFSCLVTHSCDWFIWSQTRFSLLLFDPFTSPLISFLNFHTFQDNSSCDEAVLNVKHALNIDARDAIVCSSSAINFRAVILPVYLFARLLSLRHPFLENRQCEFYYLKKNCISKTH